MRIAKTVLRRPCSKLQRELQVRGKRQGADDVSRAHPLFSR